MGPLRAIPVLLASAAVAGCAAAMVPAADYARAMNLDSTTGGTVWTAFAPGARVVVAPPGSGTCVELGGADLGALDAAPVPLADEPWARSASVWTVREALVKAVEGGYLALGLEGRAQERASIAVPGGQSPTCVWPATPELEALLGLAGTRAAFTPWKPTCRRIEAIGPAASSTLLEAEPGLEMEVGGVFLENADGGAGRVPWLELHGGTFRARADTFRDCFSTAGSPESRPPGGLALLHMPGGRCTVEHIASGEHLACTSTVGVWEGEASSERVSLRLVRRTLGPVHFLDGRPVKGDAFAKAVISVETAAPRNDDESQVYQAVRASVAATLDRSDGTYRMASPGDPAVTTKIGVAVERIDVGQVSERRESAVSEYKAGEQPEPNPAKAETRQRLADAQTAVANAQAQFDQDTQNYNMLVEQGQQTCRSGCGLIADPQQQQICYSGCDLAVIAAQFVKPTQDAVIQAQSDQANAQAAYDNEPETIMVPIMREWTYERRLFDRSASGQVRITIAPKDGPVEGKPRDFSRTWSDYEVGSDPAHNVEGHSASAGWVRSPAALLPEIGAALAAMVGVEIREATQRAALREVRKNSEALGMDSRAGFEDVDAVAVSVAGPRLEKRVQTGTAELGPGGRSGLPSRAVRLEPSTCVLAVAVVPEGDPGGVVLQTASGEHGDLRGSPYAAVEICADELPPGETSPEEIALASAGATRARWGLYRLRYGDTVVEKPAEPPVPAMPAAPAAPAAEPPAVAQEQAAPAPTRYEGLDSQSAEVRVAAVTMIAAKKDAGAVPLLLGLAHDDPAESVRIAACGALARIGDVSAAPDLQSVRLGDKSRKVRNAAKKALKALMKI